MWVVNCWVKYWDEESVSESFTFASEEEAEECRAIEEKCAVWDFVTVEEVLD
jgi:hypothetical protein